MTGRPQHHDEDDEVVARARTGDGEAWRALYRAHGARLVAWLAARSTGDSAVAAEDVAAEAWLVAADKLPEFTGTADDFAGWLFGIARRIAANQVRKGVRRGGEFPAADGCRATPTRGPDVDIPGLDWVRGVLALLPPRERDVIGCTEVIGLDTDATARALGISAVAVRVARHRGLRRLRDVLPPAEDPAPARRLAVR